MLPFANFISNNTLVCCIHFIKTIQALFLISTYKGNIKERMSDHPIGIINSFLSILLYYGCLYQYLDILNPDEHANMIHFCGLFVLVDVLLILMGVVMIGKVRSKANDLINNKRFKEYTTETELALQDILYLPQDP